jgi:protein-L-isoaspartate(D-aspartate) O-methyltransferase
MIKYKSCKSKNNKEMHVPIFQKYAFENKLSESIFLSIDRKDFCPDEAIEDCYKDISLDIGCNSHITCPTIQVLKLFYISKYFSIKKQFNKALDIGSGSGFFTLCLSKFLGPSSITYGIEHIPEIIDYSKQAINVNHSYYLNSGRIKFVCKDGLSGLPEEGPFDIIHFGAAYHEIPQSILDQLDIGGIILVTLNHKGKNKILSIVMKEENETIKSFELQVMKGGKSLKSKEEQLADL